MTPHLLALSSVARAGKDSFAKILIKHLTSLGQSVSVWAFADQLKREIDPMLRERYGISAWTQDSAEKAIIRPELVALGKKRREETNGRYWVDQIDGPVRAGLKAGIHQIVTDCRYATHATDEAGWVRSLGGKVLYIIRLDKDGIPVSPANEEEVIQDPLVRIAADLTISWPTFGNDYIDKMRPYVLDAWTRLTS